MMATPDRDWARTERRRQTRASARQRQIEASGRRPATCHPSRFALVGTLCRWCWQERPSLNDPRPAIVPRVVQHRIDGPVPDRCPHCGAGAPVWPVVVERFRLSCRMCGYDTFEPSV